MALTYNKEVRDLMLRGTITLANGSQIVVTGPDIVRYAPRFDIGYDGLPIGSTGAASFMLELDNVGRKYNPSQFDGAEVHMYIGIKSDTDYVMSDFGVWYVESTSAPEQSVSVTLFGSDALASKFEGLFTDASGAYPSTIGSLLQTVCVAAGIPLKSTSFPNAGVVLKKKPAWEDETTFRDIVSYCAIAAAGFARIALDGELEIVSFADGVTYDINASLYHTFEATGGSAFAFNAIEAKVKSDDEEYTRFAVNESIADNATNTIQIDFNPLLTTTIVNSIVTELTGLTMLAGTLVWGGDPVVKCGDYFNVEMVNGDKVKIMAMSQSFVFDGGLSVTVECALPSTTTVDGSSYSTAGSMYDSNGRIRATRIAGLDGKVITATSAHFNQLTADNVVADKLMAALLEAIELRADKIDANSIETDVLTATIAKIVEATVAKLNAGRIETDELYAALAEIITLRVKTITADKIETDELYAALADIILLRAEQINAGNITTDKLAAQYAEIVALLVENIKAEEIQTDRLGAVLAEFVSMYAKTGEFDFATIQNLVAKALALEQGSMDTVYIKNLAVTSANLLSATLGKLVLKGDDGKYYRVFVGADGGVRTEEIALTDGEIADGRTEGGQQIVETDMNVGSLNASDLQASSAVINEILTIALTAEKITAADAMIASATIPALYAATIKAIGDSLDLSANISIRQMVSGRSKIFYQEDMPEEYDPGNLWIIPSTGKTYHAIGLPGGSLTEIVVNDDFEFVFRYPPEAEGLDFLIDRYGDLLTNTEYIQLDEDGTLFAFRAWVEVPVSELHTSYIDIMQDVIRIRSGGNIEIGAGGTFNVDAGSAHFKTSDFALSILAEDGSEDTVLDFDAGSKTLRADEVKAENIRDFFPGTTTVTAAEIGGLDGLAGMLAAAQYEHVVYTQTTSDASSEVIEFNACDSMLVEIEGFTGCVVPPLAFNRLTGRMLLKNLSWNCPEQTALYADSGNVMLRRCTADAQTGVHATGSANVVWIGDDEAMTAGGACTTAFLSDEGANVKLFGLIPSGARTKTLAGTITEINVRTGAGVEVDQPDKTVTIKATLGYYGTNSGWNGGEMYQGYTSGKGRIYGCMQFDLPEEITRIKAATLTLYRVSGAGSGSNINVTVYASATEFKSRPSLGDRVAHRDKAAGTGESCTLDVTEGAKALLDGTAKQLVLYTGETKTASGVVYSRHYGKFDSAKLKITY